MSDDPFDLQRFVSAQDAGGTYGRALGELKAGTKRTHWMWFVLPQLRSLGRSETARRYGVSGLAEARAYLAHPVLGPRLLECTEALLALPGGDALAVMGDPDDRKLCSSMTLFGLVAPEEPAFGQVLDKYFDGVQDPVTLEVPRV